ncbi:hypothetical protein BDI4_560058 [Burkholderia diffusa]|nr:hypothetical protein BDI4_560058 [Burkholderia diffusa]
MWGRGGKSVSLQLFMGQGGKTGGQDAVDGALNTQHAPAEPAADPAFQTGDDETMNAITARHARQSPPASPRPYAKIATSALFTYPTGFA